MSRFAKYSLANQMLIFAQRPDATCVQGYRAWNKAGYQVRKGEHGIAIYAPMLFASKRDTAAESDTDAAPRLGYRVAYVFDIAQVDAIAGTDAAAVTATPADTGAHRHLEALKAFLVGHNVELEYKALAPGLLGYTDGRRITCGTGQAVARRIRHARPRDDARAAALPRRSAAPAPTSPRARPKPRPSPTCSARSSASPAPRPLSSTSSPTAARPTRWTPRSSAFAPPRSGSPPSSTRFPSRPGRSLADRPGQTRAPLAPFLGARAPSGRTPAASARDSSPANLLRTARRGPTTRRRSG